MSESQPAAEITTRDVLLQIDHRLSLIETDVRENNTKTEAKIDGLEAKTEAKIDGLKTELKAEMRELRREFNGKFNLVIGLVLTTWLSMMGTLFFKL